MFISNPNQLFIIGENTNKPLVIKIGEPIEFKEENRIVPESERLIQTLKQMSIKKLLTAQQYRSVKGQTRKGYYSVVHSFLIKHNYYDYFLSIPTIGNYEVGYIEVGVEINPIRKLGIYTWKDGE